MITDKPRSMLQYGHSRAGWSGDFGSISIEAADAGR